MAWWTKAYATGKEALKKAEDLNIKKMDKNVESIKKMTEGLSAKHLKLLKSKVGDVFGSTPGTISKWIKRIVGGGAATGTGAYGGSLWERSKKLQKSKGGSVRKMKAGGSVRRMNAGGAVNSRAIAKKYFKGGLV